MNYKILFLLIAFYSIFVLTCATPVGPTGGPRDDRGPLVLFTEPEAGSTNFDGDEVLFFFDEFVNRSSLGNNITIEPDLGITYEAKWKRKRLAIRFDQALPDSTTIIVTLGGNIADTKGNRSGAPTVVAFSTGDEIDESTITGRVRNAETGRGEQARKVVLYREPVDFSQPYNYTAETDTGGYFRFSFLREGAYKAFYFEDRNRNRIWEEQSEKAQPFSLDTLQLSKSDTLEIGELYLQTVDTLAPRLQAVGLFSDRRLRLRFNEDVQILDSAMISVQDTSGNFLSDAYPLYTVPEESFIVFAQSDSSLSEERSYSINIEGISDKAGNTVQFQGIQFSGSAQQDTTLQRIIETETGAGLFPNQPFVIKYATDIVNRMLVDSIVVVEGDVTFDDWPAIGVDRNRLFIGPQDSWIEGIDYQFLIWNPLTQRRTLYTPEIWDNTEMGELEIAINSDDSVGVYYYTLENQENDLFYSGSMEKVQIIENLPPLSYQLTIFKDQNGDGFWNSGQVQPFQRPELFYIRERVRVQTGFTAQVIIDF